MYPPEKSGIERTIFFERRTPNDLSATASPVVDLYGRVQARLKLNGTASPSSGEGCRFESCHGHKDKTITNDSK